MLVKESKTYGNISNRNTKMPGTTFAIDAFACNVGSKLALNPGTPCYECYARKLQRLRPSVDQGWKSNLSKWKQSKPEAWEQAMVFQILRYNTDGFHRWFDSGDLQSIGMLQSIVNVCLMTPKIKHWIPTQERGVVKQFKKLGGVIPNNLVIRGSASLLNGAMPKGFSHGSQVFTKGHAPKGKECRARTRNNSCGPCRDCWDESVEFVSYPKH